MLRENGGVIMICFLPSLTIPETGEKATLEQVADHIVYAGEKIGYNHVGIGSDFDGMLEGPVGLDDSSRYPQLVAELLRRGVAEEAVKMVLGLNIIRVLEEVERFAERAQSESTDMMCDEISPIWTPDQRALLVAKGAERKAAMPDQLGTSSER
jgi:membrane dipeptidase